MKIAIPEPCSEDWSKMTPTAQGAFCKKCALEVTDFTNKTAIEIKEILTVKIESKQRVCGHIENRQMIEFNDGFIPWKSDQESFRAVWMFSLIAVFGMTLFSCQSTFSKEIVSKMNTESQVLIEEEKNDTLDVAQLIDSNFIFSGLTDTVWSTGWNDVWNVQQDILGGPFIMNGGLGWGDDINGLNIITCVVWTGTTTILGDFSGINSRNYPVVFPETEDASFNPFETSPLPRTDAHAPFVNTPDQLSSQRTDAKHESGKPDFEAHISPNPVDKTSKIFVTIPDEGRTRLSIWDLNSKTKLHSESFDLVFGNHTIDVNFQDFPKGKYAAQLVWEEEKIVVPFEVLGTNLS